MLGWDEVRWDVPHIAPPLSLGVVCLWWEDGAVISAGGLLHYYHLGCCKECHGAMGAPALVIQF